MPRSMMRLTLNIIVVVFLTLLTQIGGIAWLVALAFRRALLAFAITYIALSMASLWIAPSFGRVALSCFDSGPLAV